LIKRSDILIIVFATIVLFFSIDHFTRQKTDLVAFDLDSIRVRGILTAVTDNNSTNYFVYRGEPMGFHFEMLEAFSDHLGVDLEIVTENKREDAFEMLRTGNADILAISLTEHSRGKKRIKFTEPLYETGQVLIQRKPDLWRTMTPDSLEKVLIRDHSGLAGKIIHIQEGNSHTRSLQALSKETGKRITIEEVPYDSEKLIQMVSDGEIEYAVCDENVALVNATYYPYIDVGTTLSSPRGISWGIRRTNSEILGAKLNQWIKTYKKTKAFALLYAKYFKNSRSNTIINSDYYTLNTGKVSRYDDIIKRFSDSINWDWRLLASLVCQESRFIPNVRSWAGAYGLMQVMPATGRNFGIDITASPVNNIMAGTLYIEVLQKIFDQKIPDENERFKFILASYNAGPGHVLDAMKLAEKNGQNPVVWDGNVADWLLKKSDPQYFNDTVVKNGYFRGKESVAFVDEILERYEHYKNVIPSEVP